MSAANPKDAPLTIAVVKPCCIGDCVMALPAVESLAAAFPQAHIHTFAGRHSAAVFRASEHVSRVYLCPDEVTPSRAPGLTWNLRTAGHDWIVVLDRSRVVKVAARIANPPRLVLLPRTSGETRHEIDVYLDALRAIDVPIATTVPRLDLSEFTNSRLDETISQLNCDFAVVHPGGAENPGSTMTGKRWPSERMAELLRQIDARGLRPVLTGGHADASLCRTIVRESGVSTCLDLSGELDLMSSAAVIARAKLYVGADTGISHLAAAVGTPSVVIFGPTNPLRYAPRGANVRILAPAASYELPDRDLRKSQDTSDLPSTADVSIEEVVAAIDSLLESGSGDAA